MASTHPTHPTHPTIAFERPAAGERFRVLPTGVKIKDVVEASRSAGLAFVGSSAMGWDRADLRSWLVLDYEPATKWTRIVDGRRPHDPLEGLDDADVSVLVDATRERVLQMLRGAAVNWRTSTFARDMIDAGLAIAVYDRSSAEAFAPASHPSMRLKDRVTSLFVADYLSRPLDYDHIAVCEACGELAIGARPRHPEWCAKPRTASGVIECARTDSRRLTMRGVGKAGGVR